METFNINGVEIFQAGTWNGDKYTENDLDDIVSSFKEIGGKLKPYLKLGHDKNQKLIQKDGMPSAGWITNLRRKGIKLIADFSSVPKKIKELIGSKAYGRISSEIYWNLKDGDKVFPKALKAVSLLGANTPAVTSLDDFIDLYTEKENYERVTTHEMEVNNMSEEIKTFEKEYQEISIQVKEYKDENEKLKTELDTVKAEVLEKEYSFIEKEVNSFIEKAIEDKKIAPALKEMYVNISLDAENKSYGKFDEVKKIIENTTEVPEASEVSEFTEKPEVIDENDLGKKSEVLHEKAMQYIKDNSLEDNLDNYKLALTEVE